jgi:hypothetical protein
MTRQKAADRAAHPLQLPASLTSVAGDSLNPPGVSSTGWARMMCLLGSLERAVRGRVRFFFGDAADAICLVRGEVLGHD